MYQIRWFGASDAAPEVANKTVLYEGHYRNRDTGRTFCRFIDYYDPTKEYELETGRRTHLFQPEYRIFTLPYGGPSAAGYGPENHATSSLVRPTAAPIVPALPQSRGNGPIGGKRYSKKSRRTKRRSS